jgi:hypothetical protein
MPGCHTTGYETKYCFLSGDVILTDTGKQRIYLWNATFGEKAPPKLLLDDGDGTVSSIEFDENKFETFYWIDPVHYAIKRMSLQTKEITTFLTGDSSSVPMTLTLRPEMRLVCTA